MDLELLLALLIIPTICLIVVGIHLWMKTPKSEGQSGNSQWRTNFGDFENLFSSNIGDGRRKKYATNQ